MIVDFDREYSASAFRRLGEDPRGYVPQLLDGRVRMFPERTDLEHHILDSAEDGVHLSAVGSGSVLKMPDVVCDTETVRRPGLVVMRPDALSAMVSYNPLVVDSEGIAMVFEVFTPLSPRDEVWTTHWAISGVPWLAGVGVDPLNRFCVLLCGRLSADRAGEDRTWGDALYDWYFDTVRDGVYTDGGAAKMLEEAPRSPRIGEDDLRAWARAAPREWW